MKKIISIALILVLALSMAVPAMAADAEISVASNDIEARGPAGFCPRPGCGGILVYSYSDADWYRCNICGYPYPVLR